MADRDGGIGGHLSRAASPPNLTDGVDAVGSQRLRCGTLCVAYSLHIYVVYRQHIGTMNGCRVINSAKRIDAAWCGSCGDAPRGLLSYKSGWIAPSHYGGSRNPSRELRPGRLGRSDCGTEVESDHPVVERTTLRGGRRIRCVSSRARLPCHVRGVGPRLLLGHSGLRNNDRRSHVGYRPLVRKGSQVPDVDQESILSQVAANIQERRNKAGLTQRDLADLAGVDRAFLNQVEHGMRNPTILVLAKLARALDITVSTLTRGI